MKKIAIVIAILILALCGCKSQEAKEVELENSDGTKIILKTWMNGNDEECIFLPSYCKLSDVSLPDKEYKIFQSENVATLFVNTESGSMDAIHEDKNYRESAEISLYTKEGLLNYSTTACSLKGRGNTTWDLFEKKPYQIKLEESADLLGMGKGKKWILLANSFDETNLRNKFIYDLARENNFCYAPECEFVDLYLNGEYRGLYLLTERVEFGEGRLNVEADEKYMCNVELAARWESLDNAFLTDAGRAVEIREPDKPLEEDFERIVELTQEMENAILDSDEGQTIREVIDLDSWVYMYLFDEIMENGDADIASSYFYYADGKFYAGPLWDYDNTLGVSTRNQNPRTFLAKSGYKYVNHGTPYYDALNEKEEFYERMVELYQTQMVPALQKEMKTGLFEEEAFIAKASKMNRIRWAETFEQQNAEITDVQGIVDYLERRMEFLNMAWLEGEEYYTVQFEPYVIDMFATSETYAGSYAVKPGECLAGTIEENAVWIDCETGERFNPSQPIVRNMTLRLEQQ